nr:transposase [uncultured archaeon]
MRRVEVKDGKFVLSDEVELVYEERVTKFGHGAKIGCSRKYLGRRVYVVVLKDDKADR